MGATPERRLIPGQLSRRRPVRRHGPDSLSLYVAREGVAGACPSYTYIIYLMSLPFSNQSSRGQSAGRSPATATAPAASDQPTSRPAPDDAHRETGQPSQLPAADSNLHPTGKVKRAAAATVEAWWLGDGGRRAEDSGGRRRLAAVEAVEVFRFHMPSWQLPHERTTAAAK